MPELRRLTPEDLEGVLRLCAAEGWPSFPEDPPRAARVLMAPGVTTVVAIGDRGVIGFAQLFSVPEGVCHETTDFPVRMRCNGNEVLSAGEGDFSQRDLVGLDHGFADDGKGFG